MSGNQDFVYQSAITAINGSTLVWETSPIWAMLVSALYVPQPNTDVYVSAIPADSILARVALTNLGSTALRVHYGTIPMFQAFTSPQIVRGVVLYSKGASDAASQLVYYSSTGNGFPWSAQGFYYVVGFDQINGGFFQQ